MGHELSLDVGAGTMGLYVAEPSSDARGAVIVLQEAFGVNEHIRDLCHRFADAGYVAVAPHLFHRSGDPELGYENMQEVMPYIMQLQADEIEADVDATVDHLAGMGFERNQIAAVGFCMGGSISFVAACYWQLGAAVTFYGGGIAQSRFGFPPLFDLAPTLQTPWLGLFGDLDQSIPTNEVDGLQAAVAKAAPETGIVRYAEANHGFHCDARSSYHEASAKDAWDRTLAFLDQHLA
ncbi:MAG TPA: dienelactone hydrolase family protein [Acidimicrobiales bacterium]|nr:dienelactone hydrolase family protein [Acidimicrobiales bacterium]